MADQNVVSRSSRPRAYVAATTGDTDDGREDASDEEHVRSVGAVVPEHRRDAVDRSGQHPRDAMRCVEGHQAIDERAGRLPVPVRVERAQPDHPEGGSNEDLLVRVELLGQPVADDEEAEDEREREQRPDAARDRAERAEQASRQGDAATAGRDLERLGLVGHRGNPSDT